MTLAVHAATAAMLPAHAASHPYWTMGATVLAFAAYGFRPAKVVDVPTRAAEIATILLLTGALILARNAP